jgi:hypothetical protein
VREQTRNWHVNIVHGCQSNRTSQILLEQRRRDSQDLVLSGDVRVVAEVYV